MVDILISWEKLPGNMKSDEVRKYYDILQSKKAAFIFKRIFDLVFSIIFALILSPVMLVVCLIIKLDSPGKIIFKQKRVTAGGRVFEIFKFRTMVENAESLGSQVTAGEDSRITKCGKWLRKLRIDEFPQIFNIIKGDLSFVGPRPEVPRYVKEYTPEMTATLLMPAGVTSTASILYKDEAKLLENAKNPDEVYISKILPEKMKYNLDYIRKFGIIYDCKIIIKTVIAVLAR